MNKSTLKLKKVDNGSYHGKDEVGYRYMIFPDAYTTDRPVWHVVIDGVMEESFSYLSDAKECCHNFSLENGIEESE